MIWSNLYLSSWLDIKNISLAYFELYCGSWNNFTWWTYRSAWRLTLFHFLRLLGNLRACMFLFEKANTVHSRWTGSFACCGGERMRVILVWRFLRLISLLCSILEAELLRVLTLCSSFPSLWKSRVLKF